ncbi:acetoin(diacetyl)reductase [Ligilactobacillus acidipiscis DSM 15836]|uniref:diacetyl reductase [(S)-acetoin forming] n=1 Tax=Ligilactobacillus acidipiscis DSM 15836 TaxID=1423716 RepID=A0ABR5PH85_9LACO|nr:acetoin reductase [Ligilactobacillus acidipiscis]KRM20192.1 acetoin(diacetyl)reductase [Ligilactobacillus acidipiscis DSM 15836]GAW64186.1 FabG-like short-chain dehydrogenase/reductase [Ligilactobacillus acidipiscis]GEN20885.1 acetoin reductase [Ligilactobacillus acidipiscis]
MSKTAIITGAGQGIGEAAAYRLAQDGFAIAVADINEKTAPKVAQNLREQGYQAQAYIVDVADRDAVFDLVDQAVADLGKLAVFVNNAGEAFIDPIIDSDPEQISHLLDVNLKGTFWGIQAAAKRFKQQGNGGRIINAASLAGVEASALQSAYSASKFGIRGLTQSAAKELAADQITVNAYNPGIVRTPLRDAIDEKTSKLKGLSVAEQQANCLTEIGLGREGVPADVAEVIAWFVSPSAAYITGQSLLVDGGMKFH